MRKIYESIEIETWQKIAQRVQRLDFSICNRYSSEFTKNLEKLKQLLSGLDICLDDLSREPKREEEIGLASLLEAIYDEKVDKYHVKAHFYEQIYQLSELGIQYLEFSPVEFYENCHSVKKIYNESQDKTTITKCYTDGDFQITNGKIKRKYEYGNYYTMRNLTNANYILFIELSKSSKSKMNAWIEYSQATLKNFNGIFPSKNEIMNFSFPKITILEQEGDWDTLLPIMKETYDCFDPLTSDYQKQLSRSKNHQYYYKAEM